MFIRLISISLIIAILTTLVRLTIPHLWYYSNYDHIAHELCENRHNPDMDCNGMCQLKKMVKKQYDHEDQQSAPPVAQEQRITLFFAEFLLIPVVPASFSRSFSTGLNQMESLWFGEPVSPPPQVV